MNKTNRGASRARRGGALSDVIERVRNVGRAVVCPSKTRPLLKGEKHYPCHNFTGPGTDIEKRLKRGDQPVDEVDVIAKEHDIEYYEIQKNQSLSKEEKALKVQEADERMLERLKSAPASIAKLASQIGIGGKNILERLFSAIKNKPVSFYGGRAKRGGYSYWVIGPDGKKIERKLMLPKKKDNMDNKPCECSEPKGPKLMGGKRLPKALGAWMSHLADYRRKHPELSLKQAMIGAKGSYRK